MKVCVLTSMFPTRVAPYSGVFVTRRIEALRAQGVSVDTYAFARSETKAIRLIRKLLGKQQKEVFGQYIPSDNPDITYKTVCVKLGLVGIALSALTHEGYFAWKSYRAAQKIIQDAYDILHVHWLYPTGKVGNMLAEKWNIPCVITCHGSDVNVTMQKKGFTSPCVSVMERADKVEFVSHRFLETAESCGYSGRNAQVLPNGIPAMPDFGVKEQKEKKVVGFVGNLIDVKRVTLFPTIFRMIAEQYPDIEFLLIGDGTKRQWLEDSLAGLPVRFAGRVPQQKVLELMFSMDVLILPSRNEGWPCVVLEAHSCGTPVVGSDCGGIPEAIGDDDFVVKDQDGFEITFAERVVRVLNQSIPVDGERLRDRAKQYLWENLQRQEIKTYQKLLSREG